MFQKVSSDTLVIPEQFQGILRENQGSGNADSEAFRGHSKRFHKHFKGITGISDVSMRLSENFLKFH